MLICVKKDSEQWQRLIKLFTVRNKNIDRQERIVGRDLSWMRYIKLYTAINDNIYVPIGRFGKMIEERKPLTNLVQYTGSEENLPDTMIDMLAEQQMIMDEIDFEDMRTWLIEMKTARGKWNLIIKLVENFQEKTLILCHNIKTLTELKKKFMDFSDYEPWVYYSKKKDIKEITITTHKSFVMCHKEFKWKFWLVIVDEADTNTSKDMIRAITFIDCDALFWLTWTPYRQDLSTEDMELIFWPHIKVKNQKNNGYNIIPSITKIMYKNNDVFSFDDWHDMKTQLMRDRKRLDHQIKFIKENHPKHQVWLLLVDRIEECQTFYDRITSEWISCCIVNGQTLIPDDEINIAKMIAEQGIIVGTAQKIGRWVDIPQIDSIYLFYPCRFEGTVVQAVWRALRVTPTKNTAKLYDRCDIPVLKGQAFQRQSIYKIEYPWCSIEVLDINDNKDDIHAGSVTN